jgi:hypothetical protein
MVPIVYSAERATGQEQEEFDRLARAILILIENGYEPVPIVAHEKKPFIRGWTDDVPCTPERVVSQLVHYFYYPGAPHRSLGLLTRKLPAVDFDLCNDQHNALILEVVEAHLGHLPLRRRGQKGMMVCFDLEGEGLRKKVLKTVKDAEGNAKTLVEFFGLDNQFVAYGVHPGTKKPYKWLISGQEPLLVPRKDLPKATAQMILEMIGDVTTALRYLGYKVSDNGAKGASVAVQRPAAIPNPASTSTSDLSGGIDRSVVFGPTPGVMSDRVIDVTQLFINIINTHRTVYRSSGWTDLVVCPSCRHDDKRAGFCLLADGGFEFHCHHGGCEYNRTTRWTPGQPPGRRVKELYVLLGGDLDDLRLSERAKKYWADHQETLQMIPNALKPKNTLSQKEMTTNYDTGFK